MKPKPFCSRTWLIISVLWILISASPLFAASLDDLRIIKISAQDQTAVVMLYEDMRVIRVGDRVDESSTVQEITEGRVVFGVKTDVGMETVILRIKDGKQSIQRIRKANPRVPTLVAPMIKEQ